MGILIVTLYILFGLVTTAIVSLASRESQQSGLSMAELLITFLFWPYFLIAAIVHLNTE